jgi:hypothetical protein
MGVALRDLVCSSALSPLPGWPSSSAARIARFGLSRSHDARQRRMRLIVDEVDGDHGEHEPVGN